MDDNSVVRVDFAIIAVREDEYRAVVQRFPKDHIFSGRRTYVISRLSLNDGHEYVIAIVRSIEQGQGSSLDVARDCIDDLDPQWLLLVGIAGGIPTTDVTLGDVVVATRLADFSVAAALEGDITQYASGGGPIHKVVQDRVALLPAMVDELGEWNAPIAIGISQPAVALLSSNFYGDANWRKSVKSSLIRHFGNPPSPRRPTVITGAIASSNSLIKDTKTIQHWQDTARQVLAVEMELARIIHHTLKSPAVC